MTFAEKLNSLATLTGTTNAKISRGISVDASMISKWRKGVRSPLNNLETLIALSDYFSSRITVDYQRETLASLTGKPLPAGQGKTGPRDAIFTWFMEESVGETIQPAAAPAQPQPPDPAARRARPRAPISDYKYTGQRGRERVLKAFIEMLEEHPGKVRLILHFDEPMDWVRFTGGYLRRLAQARPKAFDKIEQVQILVPTELVRDELEGILWMALPFLKSQPILIYHIPRIRGGLFQHFLAVAQDFMAVSSLGMFGSGHTSTIIHQDIDYVNSVADELTRHIFTGRQLLEFHKDLAMWDAFDHVSGVFDCAEDILLVGDTLNPYLLPPEVMRRDVLGLDEPASTAKHERMLDLLEHAVDAFLAHNRIYCRIPLYMPEEVEAGAVSLSHSAGRWGGGSIFNPTNYLAVLRHIHRLCTRYDTFVLAVSDSSPLAVSAIVQNRNCVVVAQNEPELVSYIADNANVAGAFFHAILNMVGEEFTPARRAESMQLLENHIAIFEERLGQKP